MSDVTVESLREHADWIDGCGHGLGPGEALRDEADRLEAEAARDEEAERYARVYHEAGCVVGWGELHQETRSRRVGWMRAVLDRLAADGRLLPEGGTGEAACLVCGRDAPPRELTTWRDADGEGHWVHPECDPTTPAVPAPDSGPDGTPEKPWPTWQDVPEGVKVTAPGMYPGEQLAKAGGKTQHWCGDLLCCTDSLNGGTFIGPFVRVDGDKA